MRLLSLVVVAALAVSGCSEPTKEQQRAEYCGMVKDASGELTRIADEGGVGAFLDALPTLRRLADAAPADLADEWASYLGALEGLDKALDRAELAPSALASPFGDDVSEKDRAAITDAVRTIGSAEVRAAATGITQQALDVCNTQIL